MHKQLYFYNYNYNSIIFCKQLNLPLKVFETAESGQNQVKSHKSPVMCLLSTQLNCSCITITITINYNRETFVSKELNFIKTTFNYFFTIVKTTNVQKFGYNYSVISYNYN